MDRQQFGNTLRTFVENAIAYDDETWGRQLATMFELHSLRLRAQFGGKPQWSASERTRVKRSRNP